MRPTTAEISGQTPAIMSSWITWPLTAAALAAAAFANEGSQPNPSMSDPRQIMALDHGWRFHFGDAEGAQLPAFDDSGWEQVGLPHTWNAADGTSATPATLLSIA